MQSVRLEMHIGLSVRLEMHIGPSVKARDAVCKARDAHWSIC